MVERKFKLVFTAKTARKLLKMGFPIVDIKAKKDNPERTVFVFENTEEFSKALKKENTQ